MKPGGDANARHSANVVSFSCGIICCVPGRDRRRMVTASRHARADGHAGILNIHTSRRSCMIVSLVNMMISSFTVVIRLLYSRSLQICRDTETYYTNPYLGIRMIMSKHRSTSVIRSMYDTMLRLRYLCTAAPHKAPHVATTCARTPHRTAQHSTARSTYAPRHRRQGTVYMHRSRQQSATPQARGNDERRGQPAQPL